MRGVRACLLAIAAVALTAATALAQEKSKTVFGLSIPDRVGSLSYVQSVDFESKTPGLGYALRFSGASGWLVDVYLYDLGLKTIPADPESSVVRDQLAQARGDVFELAKRGTYANLTDAGDFTVPASGKPRFICLSFSYQRGDRVDVAVDSFLCLTSWRDKFVKIRMTGPKGTIARSDAAAFATAWIDLLRP
jgi:hypothetical protein